MAQYIKQGNIFGRIGSGIGKGLAEQLPEEVTRGRLAAGLKQFEQDSANLSPINQIARLAAIPGITPQTQQSIAELARYQNQGNAYRRTAGTNPSVSAQTGSVPSSDIQAIRDTQFANLRPQPADRAGQNMPTVGPVNNQQTTPNMPSNANIPQVVEGNALNQQNLTRLPWTPQRRNQVVADYIDQGFLPDQAKQLQADDEARDLGEPAAYKQRLADIEEAKGKVREALKRHLETKLQKTGEGVYKDVEGRMILNAERGMTRDLIKNPKADVDNVANDWSERLYRTAAAKDKLRTLGQTTGIENFWRDNAKKKLDEYQDIFKRSGNLEEFYNMLQGPDFGMSAQGAASVAYPPNEKINKFLKTYKPSILNTNKKYEESRKVALDLEDLIGPDDSILSIMRTLSRKDPFFDQQSFLDQIAEDKDRIRLNERQRLELGQGIKNIIPNWADLLYLPTF